MSTHRLVELVPEADVPVNSRSKVMRALCTVTADNVDEVLDLKTFLDEEVGVVMRITPVATAAPDGPEPSSAIKVTDPGRPRTTNDTTACTRRFLPTWVEARCTYSCYLQTQIDFDRWWEGLLHAVAFEVRPRRDRSAPPRERGE